MSEKYGSSSMGGKNEEFYKERERKKEELKKENDRCLALLRKADEVLGKHEE